MNKETPDSDNELIAKFMGNSKLVTRNDGYWIISGQGMLLPHNFEYHSSWDWLMSVVEKIESLGYSTVIAKNDVWGIWMNIMTTDKIVSKADLKIDAVYKAVIEFIRWYNQQAQPASLEPEEKATPGYSGGYEFNPATAADDQRREVAQPEPTKEQTPLTATAEKHGIFIMRGSFCEASLNDWPNPDTLKKAEQWCEAINGKTESDTLIKQLRDALIKLDSELFTDDGEGNKVCFPMGMDFGTIRVELEVALTRANEYLNKKP